MPEPVHARLVAAHARRHQPRGTEANAAEKDGESDKENKEVCLLTPLPKKSVSATFAAFAESKGF